MDMLLKKKKLKDENSLHISRTQDNEPGVDGLLHRFLDFASCWSGCFVVLAELAGDVVSNQCDHRNDTL